MRLPRRVPWASASELDQVCAWIYTDEHDLVAKSLAVNRLSAWKNITPLPHALESTLSLLVVLQQDRNATANSLNSLHLRHSYAAAIIRLVNGLVDPLQLGAYARSIASIASQLGLPHWLVELRHAATHEDLPSIEVLREAAHQSMSWLLHNYFLPTLNPASTPERKALPLRPLGPILKQYRSVLKTITRDASLRTRYKQEVNTITRDIERWISEANVAANIAVSEVGWGTGGKELTVEALEGSRTEDIGPKEKWALEKFCDVLLEKGGLVPLSKKKRIFPEDKFWPPELSVSLWAPLLNHIQVLHADFPSTLCTHILSLLLPDNTTGSPIEAKNDPSYDICLARWVMWSLDNWSTSTSSPRTKGIGFRRDVVSFLMKALGHRTGDPLSKDTKAYVPSFSTT
ncbi:Protein LAS1 [Leucoagaricus sp. SymC.cos]|nr:Protein LAS1 [Leucoagaricus sp. SymC.cos]